MVGRFAGTRSPTGLAGVRTTFGSASSGSHRPIGSSNASRPSSTSARTAAVIGLVREAIRNRESSAIGRLPSTSAEPTAATSVPPGPATTATAPGSAPASTWCCRVSRRLMGTPQVGSGRGWLSGPG
ncbi:MAG: hypothetical protein QOI78_6471 [Actinomycetota bacterium]|nr:hypothetical protein [Actinomycetota bacterium]